jgi:hypothetical protein
MSPTPTPRALQLPAVLLLCLSLVLSTAALIVALRGSHNPIGETAYASSPWRSDLGPADALLLNAPQGKDPLRVHAADGRIAWGDRSTNRVWSVGSVDIDAVMKKLFAQPSYTDKRKESQDVAKSEEAEFNRRLEELKAKYPLADGAQPPEEAQREFAMLQQEYNRWLEGVRQRDEKLAAEQFEQAYRELVAAVETVCEKESIDLVFRFYPTAKPFEAARVGEALAQIQARTFLKYPASVDITPDVMKALNLSE